MDNIIYPFQIPIYQSFIEEDSFTQIKKDVNLYIKNHKKEFKPVWYCPTLTNLGIKEENNIKSLILNNIIKSNIEKYYNCWGFPFNVTLKIDTLWINISPKYSYQEYHKHLSHKARILFSGVLYIDVLPNSGDLVLISPIEDQIMSLLPSQKSKIATNITPQNGMIVCFPSWMAHRVGENKSPQDRISVSFNIEALNFK